MTQCARNEKEGPSGPSPCDFGAFLQKQPLNHQIETTALGLHSDAGAITDLVGPTPELIAIDAVFLRHVPTEGRPG